MGQLGPLAEGVSDEGRALCEALRELFDVVDISLRDYARLHHYDAGTVSRYLNGSRIPAWGFIDVLLQHVAEVQGAALSEDAMADLKKLHDNALKASGSPAHIAQLLQDQLDRRVKESQVRGRWSEEDTRLLADELTQILGKKKGKAILESIGFPGERLPKRADGSDAHPRVFWEKVIRDLELGVVEGGLARFLDEIWNEFPWNSGVRQLHVKMHGGNR